MQAVCGGGGGGDGSSDGNMTHVPCPIEKFHKVYEREENCEK